MQKYGNIMIWLGIIIICISLILAHIESSTLSRVHKRLGTPNLYKMKVETYQAEDRESELTEDDYIKAFPVKSFLTITTDIFLSPWMRYTVVCLAILGLLLKFSIKVP